MHIINWIIRGDFNAGNNCCNNAEVRVTNDMGFVNYFFTFKGKRTLPAETFSFLIKPQLKSGTFP